MSHIYVYSPSGAVSDRAAFRRGIRRLQAQGHEVEVDVDALARHERFAGTDEARLAAIGRAAASGADVALITRGGYGLTRLLPHLPYRALAQAVERGTRLVGLSDFTALQLALWRQTGAITWAGPALCEGFGSADGVDEITQACFDDCVTGVAEGAGWRLPKADVQAYTDWDGAPLAVHATLWGGNLSMVASLLGTPWWPAVQDGVLFLEDVGEHPYRIERMLLQLLHAGVLARQKAVVLGQFTEYRLVAHDKGYGMKRVVEYLRSQLHVPVLTGLPFGHVPTKLMLPVGACVDLQVQGREALLFWEHDHGGHEHENGGHHHADGGCAHGHHPHGAACGCH